MSSMSREEWNRVAIKSDPVVSCCLSIDDKMNNQIMSGMISCGFAKKLEVGFYREKNDCKSLLEIHQWGAVAPIEERIIIAG